LRKNRSSYKEINENEGSKEGGKEGSKKYLPDGRSTA
jgi:hypothetical protein